MSSAEGHELQPEDLLNAVPRMAPTLHKLRVLQGDKERRFSFTSNRLDASGARAPMALGVVHMNHCMHQKLHGGASRNGKVRQETAAMLHRYDKSGRLQKAVEGISDGCLDWYEYCKVLLDS